MVVKRKQQRRRKTQRRRQYGSGIQSSSPLDSNANTDPKNQSDKEFPDGLDLSNRNLEDYLFFSSVLEEANFENSNLEGASFHNAGLRGANFKNANLRYVDFQYADLTDANFYGADLTGANLNDVEGLKLQGARTNIMNINALPRKSARNINKNNKNNQNNQKDTECGICFEPLEKNVVVVGDGTVRSEKDPVTCGHKFHENCINTWSLVKGKRTCPICRGPISKIYPAASTNASNKPSWWKKKFNLTRKRLNRSPA